MSITKRFKATHHNLQISVPPPDIDSLCSTPSPPLFNLSDVNAQAFPFTNNDGSNNDLQSDEIFDDNNDPSILDLSFTFNEWLLKKRNESKRKRYLLTKLEYEQIKQVLNNESILQTRPDLKWIIPLKIKRNLFLEVTDIDGDSHQTIVVAK